MSERSIQWRPAWAVVYTKPQAEALVETAVKALGYAVFVPLYRPRRGADPRPLFPRYMFVDIAGRPWTPVRYTIGVADFVHTTEGAIGLVPPEVVEALREAYDPAPVEAEPPAFGEGDRVRIHAGPATGLTGLVQLAARERCKILLDMVWGGGAWNVPTRLLEPG